MFVVQMMMVYVVWPTQEGGRGETDHMEEDGDWEDSDNRKYDAAGIHE